MTSSSNRCASEKSSIAEASDFASSASVEGRHAPSQGARPVGRDRIRRVVAACRSAHPATRLVLETVGDATGSWDDDRIEQALINLIANAIEYGGTSPVVIRSVASAAHIVEIQVHNGGAVIPADVL